MSQELHSEGVDLKTAVQAAKKFLLELAEAGLMEGPVLDVVLEEVDHVRSGDWVITLGYRLPSVSDQLMALGSPLAELRPRRSVFFKVFTVNRATGEVVSMKNRDA